jgi:hypothetical protein
VGYGAGSEADGGEGWSVARASEARGIGRRSQDGVSEVGAWWPRMAEAAAPSRPWVAVALRPRVGGSGDTSTRPWRLSEGAVVMASLRAVAR